MPTFKVVVSDSKTGKSKSYELKDRQGQPLVGLKIGNVFDGSIVGIGKIKITGGSDRSGFPMRSDIQGGVKKKVLLSRGLGFRAGEDGERRRKLVRGNTITEDIYQINAVLMQ